ncbi:Scaffold attachment factor B1 [Heterocephalus glaber]|uniref:Scaffold attachment factor B1 n=1 Tax=Heterocephalus glaber TaxID=10181 RepID=G5BDU5_HETGA|nr:Scaffold attachment factor B1 [Heterocephalus glaber]
MSSQTSCSHSWGSSEGTGYREIEEPSLEPENEKILDILGETCKSEPVKEEGSELEQPFAQDTSSMGPDRKLVEEENLFGSTHLEEEEEEEQEEEEEEEEEEGDLDLASESTRAQWSEADTLLEVVKREPMEHTGEGASTDCELVGLEKPVEQSSTASELPEASSQELAEAPTEAPSPEPRDSKEDVKKFEFDACNEVPPAPKESSTTEEATKCISHLRKTELHGKMISVEKAKNEPASKKTSEKRDSEGKEKSST